ncbi:glycosyl transferase [Catenovulum sp. 2E275]|uniref:GH36-type glycosyl hydrolase domain-containing protein n=1 Tax=Catenovulum sp. 2E275 TaxID=2980497 RepID=UPI0021D1EB95|nr:glycosyl transferase [Catenovulum sp. 2E275]MCU4677239.1 glycosyl transferase [Catenovulum sp. 2E275]
MTSAEKEYGYYDDSQKEYVITTPYTPLPWINYLGNDGFYGLISNTAGGYCFYKDAKFRRLTRYRYNNVPVDSGGRYFYIKEGDTIWNPGGRPCQTEIDSFECRHGMGYSKFSASKNELSAQLTALVPLGMTAESYCLTLKNESSHTKKIQLFSFIEWCLWNAQTDGENFQRNLSTGEVEVEANILYHKTEYRERRNHYAFFASSENIDGYDTQRSEFIGTYNGFERPQAVINGKSNNSLARGWSPIASHYFDLTLAPGESRDFVFMLGYCELADETKWQGLNIINKAPAKALFAKVDSKVKFDNECKRLREYWQQALSICEVNTPDERFNRSINIWNQYQNMVTFNLSRSASYYESGIGRGMGFRDSHQDTIGFTHIAPKEVRQRLLDLSATQLSNGSAYHQYQPLTKKGNAEIGGNFNDDPMWMILGTANYIKETGDWSIIDEKVGFDDNPEADATHFDHLTRAFNHVTTHLGPHGLPLIGRADWNDCLNLNCFSSDPNESFQTTEHNKNGQVAESLMIAGQFVLYGKEYVQICQELGKTELAKQAQAEIDKMVQAVLQHGWDGQWFLRAYNAHGEAIGSHKNKEGKIFIESQGFCVMAGIGLEDGKAQQALDSVAEHLACDYGIMLQQPAFSQYQIELGEISSYPPGYKENAGIFCHNNPWICISEAMLGRSDKAMSYYQKITPAYLQDIKAKHKTEPYVYSQMVAGKDAAIPGEAKNSWLTGTAAWNYYAAVQYILGIRPDYQGLIIEPCIPQSWPQFSVKRQFRGAQLDITVYNNAADKQDNHIHYLMIDGQRINGNRIDINQFSGSHKIEAWIGKL